jgi:uncharacterized protein YbbC (DUF1343 family)
MIPFKLGLEVLQDSPELARSWGNCALMSNQASVTKNLQASYSICARILKERLKVLFGPQHGFWGTAQDNMIETGHDRLSDLNMPIFSLYSETRQPTDQMLQEVDTIIIDIQVVGCRIYTFKATVFGCLQAAKRLGKRVVVLDRPNPLGGVYVEGRCTDEDMLSFVGPDRMPMRHGLSVGEAALFFNRSIGAELAVVKMEGWQADRDYRSTGREWVITSPNLSTLPPVFVYPGMVLFEGSNVSEGRGTGLPFQFIGAPFLKGAVQQLKARVYELYPRLQGVYLREACFQPTSGKWQGEVCHGLQVHPVEPEKIASFSFGLALMRAMQELGAERFQWKRPPYEYEFSKSPIEVIIGSRDFSAHFARFSVDDPYWAEGVAEYCEVVKPLMQYPRSMQVLA